MRSNIREQVVRARAQIPAEARIPGSVLAFTYRNIRGMFEVQAADESGLMVKPLGATVQQETDDPVVFCLTPEMLAEPAYRPFVVVSGEGLAEAIPVVEGGYYQLPESGQVVLVQEKRWVDAVSYSTVRLPLVPKLVPRYFPPRP